MRILKHIVVMVFITVLAVEGAAQERVRDQAGHLRIADIFTAARIHPFFTASTISANLLDLIYDRVVELTSNGELEPALARSWKVSEDKLVWSFELAHNVVFHDGSSLTARDVKATLDVLRNLNGSFYSFGFSNIKSIDVVSDHNIRVTLKSYDSFFPFFLRNASIVSAALLKGDIKGIPVIGTGPFVLDSFSPEHIELKSNARYFLGGPKLQRITVDKCSNQRACLAQLIAGEADLIFLTDAKDYDVFSEIEGFDLLSNSVEWTNLVVFNHGSSIFRDKRIRRAFNYAIDRSEFSSDAIDSDMFSSFPYDPHKAIKLFKDAGWKYGKDSFLYKDGHKMEFTLVLHESDEVSKFNASMLQEFLERLGVSIVVKVFPSFEEAIGYCLAGNDFDAFMMFMNARSGMPMRYLFWHSSQIKGGSNFSGYSNKEVDRLLDTIRYSPDPKIRKDAAHKLQVAFGDDPPGIALAVRKVPSLVNSKFRGFSEDPFSFFSSLRSVSVEDGK